MSKKRRAKGARKAGVDPIDVVVCRGCCCGHDDGVDHTGQEAALHAASTATGGRPRTSDCLGPCELRNVVVVRSGAAGRGGGRPVWLGEVDDDATPAVLAWVRQGGPAAGPLPDELLDHVFTPPRRLRQELEAS